jgi:uncharacterized membrane protein
MTTAAAAIRRPFRGANAQDWLSPPEITLIAAFAVFGLLGLTGVGPWSSWPTPLRWALAAMFALTAGARLSPLRADLIAMVPPRLPHPGLLVGVTGVLEALGATGLLIPTLAPFAAWGLAALLIVMFPANVSATRRALAFGRKPATPIDVRSAQQAVFVTCAVLCAL